MSQEHEFYKRINEIHGLDNPLGERSNIEESTMDIRHAEFQAMADVFLGSDFDRSKLRLVESLQAALHDQQTELYGRYETEELDAETYVESFNSLLKDTFAGCEAILGAESFLKLFGVPRSELAGFIDKDAFLESDRTRRDQLQTAQR